MPFRLTCLNRHAVGAPDEAAGQSVRCPECGLIVPVPAAVPLDVLPPPLPEAGPTVAARPAPQVPDHPAETRRRRQRDDEDDRPRRPPPEPALQTVRLGLAFHYARLVSLLLGILALFVLGVLSLLVLRKAGPVKPGVEAAVAGLVALAAVVLFGVQAVCGVVGALLCVAIPARTGARGSILAALVCDVLAVPVGIVCVLAGLPPVPSALLGFAAWVLFLAYLRRLAAVIDQPGSANEARSLLMFGLALNVVAPLLLVLLGLAAYVLRSVSPTLVGLVGGMATLLTVFWLFLSIKYTFSVIELIGAIRGAITPDAGLAPRAKWDR